ncbi:MAG: hypothetical protein KUG59_03020 [Parvibaculaceae bacterium]|nr:hypothetical protein [Parvibaculaceae bacterium]
MAIARKFTLMVSTLFLTALLTACGGQETSHEEFLSLLDYEAQNRAFAYQSVNRMAKKTATEDTGPFWQAYADLEALNRQRYEPFLTKYDISAQARWTTRLRGWAGGVVGGFFPETAMGIMQRATVAYVPELQRLAEIAPESSDNQKNAEVAKFFLFVVEQEEVQAEALLLFSEGQATQAAAHIASFVNLHTQNPTLPQ